MLCPVHQCFILVVHIFNLITLETQLIQFLLNANSWHIQLPYVSYKSYVLTMKLFPVLLLHTIVLVAPVFHGSVFELAHNIIPRLDILRLLRQSLSCQSYHTFRTHQDME